MIGYIIRVSDEVGLAGGGFPAPLPHQDQPGGLLACEWALCLALISLPAPHLYPSCPQLPSLRKVVDCLECPSPRVR